MPSTTETKQHARPYKVVAAAQTDAFFPLFLAAERDWYEYVPKGSVQLVPPNEIESAPTIDGKLPDQDTWVVNVMRADDSVILGICDPFKIREPDKKQPLKVVGALLSKASFWVYDNNTRMNTLEDAEQFHNILCSKKGTTGYLFYELLKTEISKKNKNHKWEAKLHQSETIEGLCGDFNNILKDLNNVGQSIVITPNIYDIELFKLKNSKDFNRCYSFPQHPTWGDFLTTGILASPYIFDDLAREAGVPFTAEMECRKSTVIKILMALQRALLEIKNENNAVLSNIFVRTIGDKNSQSLYARQAANESLKCFTQEGVFPVDLKVNLSAWHSRMYLDASVGKHSKPNEANAQDNIENSVKEHSKPNEADAQDDMGNYVRNELAHAAFQKVVIEPIEQFNKLQADYADLKSKNKKLVEENRTPVRYLVLASGIFLLSILFWSSFYIYYEYDEGHEFMLASGAFILGCAWLSAVFAENSHEPIFKKPNSARGFLVVPVLAILGGALTLFFAGKNRNFDDYSKSALNNEDATRGLLESGVSETLDSFVSALFDDLVTGIIMPMAVVTLIYVIVGLCCIKAIRKWLPQF